MHSFEVHSNESACRESDRLGLKQVIGVDTLQKASEVSVQGTESGGAPDQGVYDSNGLLFHGTYPDKKWFSDSVKTHWEDIRRARDASNRNSDSSTIRHRGRPYRKEWNKKKRKKSALEATISELNIKKSKIEASISAIVTDGSSVRSTISSLGGNIQAGNAFRGRVEKAKIKKK